MDPLQDKIEELKQFIVDLKADKEAAKAKEKKEAWTKYVALSVVIIAVIATVAVQWSGKYSGTVTMSQAQASDQWAFYQAKSIKQHLDETTLVQLINKTDSPDAKLSDEIKKLKVTISRYDGEKAEIKAKADALEKKRDEASRHGGKMGLAVSLFTVAIATASICTVTKKKPLWFVSLAISAAAIIQMIIAWTS